MKKMLLLSIFAVFLSGVAARADLGGGTGDGPCDSSPENPTLILAAIGASGAGLAALRVRLAARRNRSK